MIQEDLTPEELRIAKEKADSRYQEIQDRVAEQEDL